MSSNTIFWDVELAQAKKAEILSRIHFPPPTINIFNMISLENDLNILIFLNQNICFESALH